MDPQTAAAAPTLPTFEEALAQPPAQDKALTASTLPTFDEALSKPANEASPFMTTLRMFKPTPFNPSPEDIHQMNEGTAQFLKHTAVGRIMDAVGHGIGEGFGDAPLGLSPESQEYFTKAGLLPDYKNGQTGVMRAIGQAFIAPAAAVTDLILRGGSAAIGGTERLATQTGEEVGLPSFGKGAAEIIDYQTQRGDIIPALNSAPRLIKQARGQAVIGEGEAGYFGTSEPTPEELKQRNAAAVAFHTEQDALHEAQAVPPAEPKAPITPEQQTVHDVARSIAPDTFGEYDALQTRKDSYTTFFNDLIAKHREDAEASAPHNAEIEELRAKMEDANARKSKIYQEQIDQLAEKNEDYVNERMNPNNFSDDIKNVRGELAKVTQRIGDLAPDVRDAYRKAQEQMPKEETTPESVPSPQTPEFEKTEGHLGEFDENAPKAETPPAIPDKIAQDVSEKLTAAGRPTDEARAAADLVAAHYQARSQRFRGLLGNAQEMYERDGAAIEKGKSEGKTRLGIFKPAIDSAKAVIRLMKSANASTFIHETGHHWLDELLQDANHNLAPEGLKKDAKTVRDWLDVAENVTLREKNQKGRYTYEKQHEKFARGFERYLMEGTAPSKELAGVFYKFKAWLTQIYQTVAGLKSPITDEIRGVFDRLLAENPEKTVIAPDREPSVREEVAPASPAPSASPVAGLPEVTEAQKKEVTPAAEPEKSAQTTPQPNTITKNEKTDLVDKAGNIRLENLTDKEDVKQVMRQLAENNHDFYAARRGVVTDQEVSDLADAMGKQAREVNLKRLRAMSVEDGIPLAARIQVGRQMLVQSAQRVAEMMANTSRGIEDDIAFAKERERHLMIAETVAGVTAETGRALRAFKDISGEAIKDAKAVTEFLQRETGLSLSQLQSMKKVGASMDTPAKLAKFMQDSTKPRFGEQVLEYWTNGLVSGPATHTTYATGNETLTIWRAVPETLVASMIGNTVKAGESWARLKAIISSLPTALSAAGSALKTGATTLLPGEELKGMPFQGGRVNRLAATIGNEATTWKQLGQDTFGAMKGLRDGFIATAELIKNGGVEDAPLIGLARDPFRAIPNIQIKGVNALPVGSAVNLPYRAIAGIHSFFRTANYAIEKAALAYRQASGEGLDADGFNARIADIITNPSEEIMKESRANATENTLMGQGGELTKAMSKLTNVEVGGFKPLKFIDPFVHISSNVIEQSLLKRTPLGLLSSDIRADLMGQNGLAARDYARARMIVGSALGVTWGLMASQGVTSGSGPSNPKEAAMWRLAGNQAHSVKVGDTWYDVHRLGPLGLLVSVAADMHDFVHGMSDADLSKVGGMFVHAVAHNILDESFMRGPSELIRAVTDDRYGATYVKNFVSSFVPFSVGMSQVARAIDPYSRQTRSVMDAIIAKIPWKSQELPARQDVWGQSIINKDVLGVPGFSSIYETRVNQDPVNKALLKLHIYPSLPERKIRGVPLTDAQHDELVRLGGQTMKMRLDAFVNTPGFDAIPDNIQTDTIHKIMSVSRETARSIIMMKNPDIIQKAIEAKQKAIGIKSPSPNAE